MHNQQRSSEFLVEKFDTWRQQYDSQIQQRYERIVSVYVQKTNEFINHLIQLSGELFDVHTTPFSDIEQLQWKHTFYYQFGDAPLFLEVDILKVSAPLLPKTYLRKRYLKRIVDNIEENVMRHCGKLRYEYGYSIQESYRKFLFDMNEKTDEVLNEINRILATAMQRRQEVESYIEEELDRLKQYQLALQRIEQESSHLL